MKNNEEHVKFIHDLWACSICRGVRIGHATCQAAAALQRLSSFLKIVGNFLSLFSALVPCFCILALSNQPTKIIYTSHNKI